ncbi:MAG: UDP-N-acetylmuramoylalanyl-D-glutamyl-2,6-diaminopimelate--D-alanyl-D-alanine ligase [Bauldia sp.]|uniref:UDP-N-acetylmuramoylalanyl-D-glutamyl-2, 6-diaminopimelate--D-alanyl-D-alanine ligase n=1 Tax=Bauldia sp. TaxID=2575872 RepID=UPI001D98EEE0|nr:UDP-N-acetylmuramoylalanyl-D-glutamyl-2,6-diaminopimelate--D-alanyl-D-alanine ligase [Bauldia sp.]MCB1495214.1 UDP-N-acetylmuramoylalanyl-D-glutamyl-2,6-diaminopimelate--D-alanyl-D-alanine ligase [Bauldia sp.]
MSAPLWTFDAFVAAIEGRPVGVSREAVSGISIDSRTVQPGDAFFAIRGDNFDGHDFVTMAMAGGAGVAVISEARLAALGHITGTLIVVDDVLQALVRLGRAARGRSQARIAAVTGSVGKTGTKAMLARALSPSRAVHASPASFNNHWGVPLTLSRMPPEAEVGIFEIGMNHAGEIEPLVRMVRPHVAIITTVAPVHLEYFGGVEEIARAKAEIFLGVEPGGAAILNRDNDYFDLLASLAREAGVETIIGFGEHPEAEARVEAIDMKPESSGVLATILGTEVTYELGAPGRHMIQNSLAVLAAVDLLGGDLEAAATALGRMTAPGGRGARLRLDLAAGSATLIDESYNANPVSMRAAIALLGQSVPPGEGRRIAVLGDMLELGVESAAMHADLSEALVEAGVDMVFLAGPEMMALWEALPDSRRGAYAETAAELEPIVAEALRPGDVVMVKGSNASRMGPLVAALRSRFEGAASGSEQGREIA